MARDKFSKQDLKKHLEKLDREEIAEELLKLYSKFEVVKRYYTQELGSIEDRAALLGVYKEKISLQFFPKRGFGDPKSAELRKWIGEYKKVAIFKHEIVELILHRVDCSIRYSNKYGYLGEAYYNAMSNAFKEALTLIRDNVLFANFEQRCKAIAYNPNRQQWIMEETLENLYKEYYKYYQPKNKEL